MFIAMRPAGDTIVIAQLSRLVFSLDDGLKILRLLADRQATLEIAENKRSYTWTLRDSENIELVQAMLTENRKAANAVARAAKSARSTTPKLEGATLRRARQIWSDPAISNVDAATQIGVPIRTLYAKLGKRGR